MTKPTGIRRSEDRNGLPWFMWWRPVGNGVRQADYRWWSRPIAPIFVAWCDWRLRREVARLRRQDNGSEAGS